ncbi:MAG TPA: GNAT family N-acetyltransferase [Afifellaceae bacterium]|nr:GNAT family N-acetyltransferase [Afifellaceae bacterium]
MSSTIRPAEASDLAAVERTVERAYAHYVERMGRKPGPMLDDYAARIAEGRVRVLESDTHGVCGVLVLITQDDAMLLDNVAVDPAAQGSGFGRQLVAAAERAARDAGYAVIRLYTHATMAENIALYQRLGYRRAHRVTDKGFDRFYMGNSLA